MKFLLFAFVSFLTCFGQEQVVVDEDSTALPSLRCLNADEFDANLDYFDGLKYSSTDYTGPVLLANGGEDAFPDKVETDITTDLFDIAYYKHYKIITNHFVNKTYLLYLCGTLDMVPAEELQEGKHHLVVSVPHTGKVAVTETPQIPFLELLGLRREVIAYIGDPQWVSSPCLNYMINEENSIAVVVDREDPFNASTNQILRDQYIKENPDVIIFGGPYADKDADRTVIMAATQERTTVATFDWIGYFAAFFNLEAMSNQIAAETKARFDCSSANAATLSADRPVKDRPVVLWANYFDGYNWSMAECPTWDAVFYCEYAAHCGANIISRPEGFGWNDPEFGGTFWYVDDDQLLELGKDADYFIYPGNWTAIYETKKDLLDQIKAVQNKQVFDTSGKGPKPWYEQRFAEYEVVALDFCEIVGTASNSGTGEPHRREWLRNVFTEPMGSLPECKVPDDIAAPYDPDGAQCVPVESSAVEDTGSGSQTPNQGAKNSTGLSTSRGETLALPTALVVGFINAFLVMAL